MPGLRLAAVLLALWAVAASAPVAQVAAPVPAPPAPAKDTGRHLIWRMAKGDRTVAFLVGSVHVLTKAAYPLPAVFDTVFEQSGTLVEEVDLGAANDISALLPTAAGAVFTDGQTLRSVLDPATFAQVQAKAATAGFPIALVERMKPWLVSMLLVVPELSRAGFDPSQGLDRHYYERARAAGRTVRGLETAAYQVERLNGLPLPVQVDMLKATLDDVEAQVAVGRDHRQRLAQRRPCHPRQAAAAVVPRQSGDLPAPARRSQPQLDPADCRVCRRTDALPGRGRRRPPAGPRRAGDAAQRRRVHARADVVARTAGRRARRRACSTCART